VPLSGVTRRSADVEGRLEVVERRLAGLRREEAAALGEYREACAELLTGRGVEGPVERAERTLARVRRGIARAEAAAEFWRGRRPLI
jgi:hypothetical protein